MIEKEECRKHPGLLKDNNTYVSGIFKKILMIKVQNRKKENKNIYFWQYFGNERQQKWDRKYKLKCLNYFWITFKLFLFKKYRNVWILMNSEPKWGPNCLKYREIYNLCSFKLSSYRILFRGVQKGLEQTIHMEILFSCGSRCIAWTCRYKITITNSFAAHATLHTHKKYIYTYTCMAPRV